jgi:hypothetical protein
VILTGVLGYLFAFPLPRLLNLPPWTGAVGLTASAGMAGWLEFLLLRRAISRRIGPTGIPRMALARLWIAGLAAGAAGWGVMLVLDPRHQMVRGIAALLTFAVVYGAITVAFGVPEARALMGRVTRR